MGLTIETWNIAYRKKREGLLDNCKGFKLINNGYKGWYADPFLFDHNGETFLFAEFYSYRLRRGVIVYARYNRDTDCFSVFKEIIREKYHLSYPIVFQWNDEIYMLPESNKSGALYYYKAVSFPEKWEKSSAIISNIKLVDTTPFVIENTMYAYGIDIKDKTNALLLFKYEDDSLRLINKTEPCDMSVSRPGGNVIKDGNQLIAVTQDCSESYGKALNFISMDVNHGKLVFSKIIKKIVPTQIELINHIQAEGIHTYNCCNELEVIDLKYYRKSYYRIIFKIISYFIFKKKIGE